MAFPFNSAVLLIHNPDGAEPIGSAAGLAHRLDYDARQGRYKDEPGIEKELTEEDERLLERRMERASAAAAEASEALGRRLDYDSRTGMFSEKGAGRIEDASFWGQNGPLTRQEVEADMHACGGCYLQSVVSVSRAQAAELGLDTKQAFERLLRDNWQNMMAIDLDCDAKDVHWYACYHTDAENSLHVHIATWKAGGDGWEEGEKVTFEHTLDQRNILYRDAYRVVGRQLDLEWSYQRSFLIAMAKVECGLYVPEEDLERVRRLAAEAGFDVPKLERTVDAEDMEWLRKRMERVSELLEDGTGRLGWNWKAESATRALVDDLAKHSAPFAKVYRQMRQGIEVSADRAGVAVKAPSKEQLEGIVKDPEKNVQHETQGERAMKKFRRDFVDERLKDIRHRICVPLMRQLAPDGIRREMAKDQIRAASKGLVRDALDSKRNPLHLEPAAQEGFKRLLERRIAAGSEPGDSMKRELAAACETIAVYRAAAGGMDERAEELSRRFPDEFGTPGQARDFLVREVASKLEREVGWRCEKGFVSPYGMEARRELDRELPIHRGILRECARTQGLSLGLSRSEGVEVARLYAKARRTGDKAERAELGRAAARVITGSEGFRSRAAEAVGRVASRYGAHNLPKAEKVMERVNDRVEKQCEREAVAARSQQRASSGAGIPIGRSLGVSYLVESVVREAMRERRTRGADIPHPHKQNRKKRGEQGY